MKKNLLLFSLVLATQPVFSQDYNKLDKEFQDIAVQALSRISTATQEWFITTSEKHPEGNFDFNWAKGQLNSKFTSGQMNEMGGLFAVMMAYLKQVQKEMREDRKLARNSASERISFISSKIKLDNKSIDHGMAEARQKADVSMAAANTEMTTGVVSGSIQASSAAQQKPGPKTQGKTTPDGLKVQKTYLDSVKDRSTERQKKELNNAKTSTTNNASADRKKATTDNLQKMLDIISSMKTQL